MAATALVYLFPELFAPGCGGMPRAFAACPAACRITTCTDWDAPGENGCNAKPPHKGCCRSYETTCDPDCEEEEPPDPDPTPVPIYPPSVSGSVSCTLNGSNGWCRNGAALNLSASDPQGYATTLGGDIAGAAFSCAGPTCVQTLPAGSGAIHFQASSPASGLSSAVGSTSFAYDPTPPTATLVISGTPGTNGWYTAASVSTTGTDAISGVDSTQVSVDGGAWQASATLAEGTHSIVGRAFDRAGNLTTTPAQAVKVDATPPTISASVTSGTQVAGWYVTDVTLTAVASDAISGLALIEHRLDGGTWLAGDHLIVSTEGPHTVDFRATDQAGLRATTSLSFQVDKTPPVDHLHAHREHLARAVGTPARSRSRSMPRMRSAVWPRLSTVSTAAAGHPETAWCLAMASILWKPGPRTRQAIYLWSRPPRRLAFRSIPLRQPWSQRFRAHSGKNNWYVSDVTVSASVSDATSGVALTEYAWIGSTWTPGTSVTAIADGAHTVQFRVTDRAGNQSAETRTFQIDQTKPLAGFTTPVEASTGTLAQGAFLLEGQATDAMSGLASVQISTDEGRTWLDLAASPAGLWHYTWETKPFENGLYPVLARAQDLAGNVNAAAHVTLLLANHPPKVTVQESWWIWEAGKLSVQERFLPVTEISLRIACLDGQPDVKLNFTLKTLPEALSWDRKCGEGQFATSGDHLVTLKACDQVGNCASAEGTIKVPFIAPPIPTWTPTVTPTATSTPSPTHEPRKPTPTATRPVIVPTQEPPAEVPVEKPLPMPWLWPSAAFLGLLLAFGLSSLLDPRPAALRRLRETWQK